MEDLIEKITSFRECPSIRVGPWPVLWLPREQEIAPDRIDELLVPAEITRAAAIRAEARRAEYRRVRWLIRRATGWNEPLPPGAGGSPSWPPGYVGSITHKDGLVAFTMGRQSDWLGVGLDWEDTARVKPEFEERLADEAEGALLTALAESGRSRTELLAGLFAFKEALFKCHYPLGEKMFWFHDAEIVSWTGDRVEGEVRLATSPHTPRGHRTEGRVTFQEITGRTYAVAAAWLPQSE